MGQRREAPSLFLRVPKIYHLHMQDATERRSSDHGNNSQASRAACYLLIGPVTCGPIIWTAVVGRASLLAPPYSLLSLTVV